MLILKKQQTEVFSLLALMLCSYHRSCVAQVGTVTCDQFPCKNSGTCVPFPTEVDLMPINSFTCQCPVGTLQPLCDSYVPCSSSSPCMNGGTCPGSISSVGNQCSCLSSFVLPFCTTDCRDTVCENGGTCTHHGICHCYSQFQGAYCEVLSACVSGTCQNGGSCMSLPHGGFKCSCLPGWTDTQCTRPTCSPSPCGSRGACSLIQQGTAFFCSCFSGWTGATCTQPTCSANVCSNGGTCLLQRNNGLICNCPPGWTGTYCSQPSCSPNPCGTRGACSLIRQDTAFFCSCFSGWTGATCTQPTCSANVCSNGGTCLLQRNNGLICSCPPGWTGTYCSQPNCSPNPCRNGGLCNLQVSNNFMCSCLSGWTGTDCSQPTCVPNPCTNGGSCTLEGSTNFTCKCGPGWTGKRCTQRHCISNPCMNGGSCIPLDNSFHCACAPGWTGPFCLMDVDECTSTPCLRGGICIDHVNSYMCNCQSGWSGSNCATGCTFSNQVCNEVSCHCLRDEVCNYNSGACLRSNCTILNCPAAIESVTLSKVNPSSSANITCTLIGSTAVLLGLQLRLSREPEGLDGTGITGLIGNEMNSGYSVQGTFRAHKVTKEMNLYCVLLKGNYWIGRVQVTDFVYELPTLSAAPIPGNVSDTSVTIRWRAWDGTVDDGDPPVVAYIPYYLRSSSMEWQQGGKVSVGRPFEFQADNLEVDIQYDFSVAAVREGENGEGPRSPSVTVKTLCNAPDMPISVNTQLASSNRVNVSWQLPPGEVMCSTGVTRYKVYYRIEGSIEDTPQLAGTVKDVGTRWFILDEELLEPGSFYIFFVTVTTDQESDFRESEPIQAPAGPGSGPLVGIIVAVISIVFLLIILLLVVFLLIKRKRDKKADDNTPVPKPVDNTYDNPVFGIPDVRRHNAEPAKAAEPVPRMQPSVREDYDSKSVESLSIEKESSPDDVIYGNLEQPKPIRVAEFGEYFRQNVDKFDHEFSILEGSKKQFDWTAAEDPANKKKNRFKSMYTYDHSRVVLRDLPDQEGSDYYNASFIKDTNDVIAYIASQAPNRASLEDFVRMIWEQHVTTIVMVANLYEEGKERCLQYWPENEGGSTSFGSVTVTWLKTTQFSDFVIRYFTFKRGKETREVQQLHFLTWPDKDTPEHGTALIEFTKQSKILHRGKKFPMLVHCSAGIGRTGTFICLNCMMDVLRDEEYIDVFGFVNKIRQNRINMVQTSKQYVFLYKCLNEYYLTHQTEMSVSQMTRLNVESHRGILLGEFELLSELGHNHRKDTVKNCVGKKKENIARNRVRNMVPSNRNRVFLMSPGQSNEKDYINASYVKSFQKKDAFITTQSPLPSTIEDFWRMVYDVKSPLIVMLNQLDPTDKTCVQYWPDRGSSEYGNMYVTCVATERQSDYTQRTFEVKHVNLKDVLSVIHLQMEEWRPDINLQSIVGLIKDIDMMQKRGQYSQPIVIHCINGFERSGVVVTVKSELERIAVTERIDVFSTVKKLRDQHEHMLKNKDDYILCYHLLKAYVAISNRNYENSEDLRRGGGMKSK